MRQRASILLLAAAATASLLLALWRQQVLTRERETFARHERELAQASECLGKKLGEAQGQNQALAAQVTSLKEEAQKLSATEGAAERAKSALELLEGKVGALEKDALEARKEATSLGAKLKALEAQVPLQADRLIEELRRRDGELLLLKQELESIGRKLAVRLEPAAGSERKPPPAVPVNTSVMAVEPGTGVVVLGAGKSSGLEIGHELTVCREQKVIGRLRVLKVYDDMAGADVLETAPGETIRVNDAARTGSAQETAAGRKIPPPPPAPHLEGAGSTPLKNDP